MTFDINDSILGKDTKTPEKYDVSLLFRIPRSENREHYNIQDKKLPFLGVDVWNCYEVSFLTNNGLPVSRVLKLIYSCDSKYLVESKSLKLYLNAFNMERFGKTVSETVEKITEIIATDLSTLLETEVKAILLDDNCAELKAFPDLNNKMLTTMIPEAELEQMEFSHFHESPHLLACTKLDEVHEYAFRTDLLRSNCRVTNQPDWGDLYVRMHAKCDVDLLSVVAYLVSFRKENHFHEEVVEMIFKRFLDIFNPEKLMVAAMYTRRGGIDINPIRSTHTDWIDNAFVCTVGRLGKTLRQ